MNLKYGQKAPINIALLGETAHPVEPKVPDEPVSHDEPVSCCIC